MEFFNKLSEPLTRNDVELRVGATSKNGFSLLLYKTARTDVKRLNQACGINWSNRFYYDDNNLLCCGISVFDAETKQWVERVDVGTESMTEKEKGLYSDSFKRAGFKWGIGLELYNAPFIFVKWEMDGKKPKGFYNSNLSITDYDVIDGKVYLSISYSGKQIFSNISEKPKDTAQQEQKRKLIASYNAKLKDVDNIDALRALFMDYQSKAKSLGETAVKAIIDGKDKKKAVLDALHVQQMDATNENNEG